MASIRAPGNLPHGLEGDFNFRCPRIDQAANCAWRDGTRRRSDLTRRGTDDDQITAEADSYDPPDSPQGRGYGSAGETQVGAGRDADAFARGRSDVANSVREREPP